MVIFRSYLLVYQPLIVDLPMKDGLQFCNPAPQLAASIKGPQRRVGVVGPVAPGGTCQPVLEEHTSAISSRNEGRQLSAEREQSQCSKNRRWILNSENVQNLS